MSVALLASDLISKESQGMVSEHYLRLTMRQETKSKKQTKKCCMW